MMVEVDLMSSVPEDVLAVLSRLTSEGYRAYLVGGCVRDLLLGDRPADWDLTTDARPDEIASLFEDTVPTGVRFGTVSVLTDHRVVEITTFRVDDGGVMRDLERRDVTINAMAVDAYGKIIDPHRGQEDLKNRVVRAVGDPGERFREDPLRLLRVVRLAADKGFAVETETMAAMAAEAGLVTVVAGERITGELQRMLLCDRARLSLQMLVKLGLADCLFPELARDDEGWLQTAGMIERLSMVFPLRMAGLLAGCDVLPESAAVQLIGRRLRWDARTLGIIKRLLDLVGKLEGGAVSDYRLCRLASVTGRGWLLPLAELADERARVRNEDGVFVRRCTDLLARAMPLSVDELAIDGDQVMELTGLEPGPEVGIVLQAALEWVWENPDWNTRLNLNRFVVYSHRNRWGLEVEGQGDDG